MKILFLGLVLTLSATPSFAKCTYSINGNEFTPFNGKTVKVGSVHEDQRFNSRIQIS